MSKPRVEKVGSIWWVNLTVEHQGFQVQRARAFARWDQALGFALDAVRRAAA